MLPNVANGRSAEPSVRALVDAVGLTRGTLVSHAQIEAIIGEPCTSTHYRSVIAAWRRRLLREFGVHLESQRGVGYTLVKAPEQLRAGARAGHHAVRRLAHAQAI